MRSPILFLFKQKRLLGVVQEYKDKKIG